MMTIKKYTLRILILSVSCLTVSCTKQYLDKKPNQALLVPTTLSDFQALMEDADDVMNIAPGLNELAADNFYIIKDYYPYLPPLEQNCYLWAKDIYQGSTVGDWNNPYKQVFYANVVLDGLNKIKPDAGSQTDWNRVKGSALFYRAIAFYHLAQLFAVPYISGTVNSPGIPIRLTSDVNFIAPRGTLEQTYAQIISDLTTSLPLLPDKALYKNRPCKSAVDGLLARIYQTMGNYDQAKSYATASLNINNTLIDYNSLNPNDARPLPAAMPNGNDEVLFYSALQGYTYFQICFIDSDLYNSYQTNDLRKTIFFDDQGGGTYFFKGTYSGNSSWFSGIATDEIYLIRAEAYARLGDAPNALADLNKLLLNRWKKGTFTALSASTTNDALKLVLTERRKELIGRGLRWTDLRRLNMESGFAITLTHNINGQTYTLLPNDKRYVFAIPNNEIANSGIQQNDR